MFEGQWNFGSIPLQDSREASETSQDGTFLLNRGEKTDKTSGLRGRHKSAPAADSLVNENAHYASIDARSKRMQPELPAMAAAALQKLLAAVRVLDIVEVSRLLKLGAPVNEPNPDIDALGMCCLHYAGLRGRQHISDPVPEGVDDGPEGGTRAAAMVAVLCDAGAEVVAELLNRGAFMDVQDDEVNYTPMHAAAEAGQVGAMLLMIEAGAFIDEQVRMKQGRCKSSEAGLVGALLLMVERGAFSDEQVHTKRGSHKSSKAGRVGAMC
ncbi:hypothetical protein DUNSADRAFT_16911 [Dunaliella salina]|uniref:Uncharacterized protein n=1 Tax=Dunaliella salina TaxID=3046 RepID=A0ABQ7H980_DUNSA|nr:hypothetical protein DUNSADRAFT_16911 [Dunaliella salina]|eukprot:KAF5843412.1 hypothetical protein DUNSADRAFT_16911 [Dunaliella salina]